MKYLYDNKYRTISAEEFENWYNGKIELPKKTKNKKDGNKNRKRFFDDFDEMKFEIAILIDNRNFCEKFICELKVKMYNYFVIIQKRCNI